MSSGSAPNVTRTYLEMRAAPGPLAEAADPLPPGLTLEREHSCSVALARALYAAVGRPYHWYDRDAWTDERLTAHLAMPNVETWVLREGTRPLGYFELLREGGGSTEIVYFGLVPRAQGRGLGRRLLEGAIRAAFGSGTTRVWLHTCTLDHPAALPNYQARGFIPFKTEQYQTRPPALT